MVNIDYIEYSFRADPEKQTWSHVDYQMHLGLRRQLKTGPYQVS